MNKFVFMMAFVAFLVALVYATPQRTSEAINAETIEKDEKQQFELLLPTKNDHVRDEDDSDDVDHNDHNHDHVKHIIVEESNTTPHTDDHNKKSTETTTKTTTAVINDNDNNNNDSINHKESKFHPLISELLDDLQRRTIGKSGGNSDFQAPTHRKHAWGGRGLERNRY